MVKREQYRIYARFAIRHIMYRVRVLLGIRHLQKADIHTHTHKQRKRDKCSHGKSTIHTKPGNVVKFLLATKNSIFAMHTKREMELNVFCVSYIRSSMW